VTQKFHYVADSIEGDERIQILIKERKEVPL